MTRNNWACLFLAGLLLTACRGSSYKIKGTTEGIDEGEWSLWLDSETIAQGTSRKQTTLNATQTFNIDAKGYRVYVRGSFPEQDPNTGTAIRNQPSASNKSTDSRYYNINGCVVDAPTTPGLYIHAGRKIILR